MHFRSERKETGGRRPSLSGLCCRGRYTVRFRPGQLPPVNAFWSLTMYELPASLLTENPIDRYLINSPMEPNLVRGADGGITIYVQHQSPGKDKEPNWLPAPKGPFFMVLRQYWPKPEALDGSWKVPQAVRAAPSSFPPPTAPARARVPAVARHGGRAWTRGPISFAIASSSGSSS